MFSARTYAVSTAFFCFTFFLSGCNVPQSSAPPIGVAYAGPATMVLRSDIDPNSKAAATVRHGEKLDILAQRRRWYRVRAESGIQGWTDDRQLLDRNQMNRLRQLAKETEGLPSQGTATSFDVLNIHTEPNRQSPSFAQVKEGEKFDIIVHRVMQRVPLPRRQFIEPRPRNQKRGKARKKPRYPEPDPPPPPVVPADWLELSRQRGVPVADIADEQIPEDDWLLVRTHNGQTGWVLTGRVYMALPDEVAQYAEGHRIMSYFSLGKVQDGELRKDIWLWTTADHLGEDHDFDGYRVFVWNSKRHRYETAYIQRRIRGFFPVLVKGGDFSLCLETDDNQRIRKMYSLVGNIVRPSGERPCEAERDVDHEKTQPSGTQQLLTANNDANASRAHPSPSWTARAKEKISSWFARK